jgi:hypothetical protein
LLGKSDNASSLKLLKQRYAGQAYKLQNTCRAVGLLGFLNIAVKRLGLPPFKKEKSGHPTASRRRWREGGV